MTRVQSKNAILFDIVNDEGPLRDALVDMIGEGTTVESGLISPEDKTKLDGIAVGATANAADAALRNRTTHTGEQAIDTITGLIDALAGKATAAQGALADTAIQAADLATVATTGAYSDLTGTPTLGTAAAANTGDFATAAQGALADTALQVGDSPTNVVDRTALKALNTTSTAVAYLREAGREGHFKWKLGDYSTHIATDTAEGVFIEADAIAPTAGAWVRVYDELDLRWFGAAGDGSDATSAFSSAIAVANFLGLNRIVCKDSTKRFKLVELEIPGSIAIDMGGATLLADFNNLYTQTCATILRTRSC